MSDTEEMRTCRVCGEVKPLIDFEVQRAKCRKCEAIRAAAYRANPEVKARKAAYKAAYYAKPEVRIRRLERSAIYRNRPEVKAKQLAYRNRPEVKARKAARDATPEAKAREAAYRARLEVKLHRRLRGPSGYIERREYDTLLESQRNRCPICLQPFTIERVPQKDHNHTTLVVRGLLCKSCNQGIGHLNDDPARLRRAITYLRKSAVNGELPLS